MLDRVVRLREQPSGRVVGVLDRVLGVLLGVGVGRADVPGLGAHAVVGVVLAGSDLAVAVGIARQVARRIVDVILALPQASVSWIRRLWQIVKDQVGQIAMSCNPGLPPRCSLFGPPVNPPADGRVEAAKLVRLQPTSLSRRRPVNWNS